MLRTARSEGYIVTKDGRMEHRVVWEKAEGKIPKGWVVHHINEIKSDNRIENLIALPSHFHDRLHDLQRKYKKQLDKVELTEMVRLLSTLDETSLKEIAVREARIKELEKELHRLNGQRAAIGFDLLRSRFVEGVRFADKTHPVEIPVIAVTEEALAIRSSPGKGPSIRREKKKAKMKRMLNKMNASNKAFEARKKAEAALPT